MDVVRCKISFITIMLEALLKAFGVKFFVFFSSFDSRLHPAAEFSQSLVGAAGWNLGQCWGQDRFQVAGRLCYLPLVRVACWWCGCSVLWYISMG